MHFTTATILSALAAAPLVSGLGINCRGSGGCISASNTMRTFQSFMRGVDPAYSFSNGQQIVCNQYSICVFFQSLPNGVYKNTAAAQKGLDDLVAHGCNVCGSDPTEPGNDVSKGQLTVNYIQNSNPLLGYV